MWDKGEIIAILSQTKISKNTIFVVEKNHTISAMKIYPPGKTNGMIIWRIYFVLYSSILMMRHF